MRDFFIGWYENIVAVIIVIMSIGVVMSAASAGSMANQFGGDGGAIAFVVALVGGTLGVLFVGGALYLALGIYHNTKRAAEATEQLLKRSQAE